jgi:hypothetical protein
MTKRRRFAAGLATLGAALAAGCGMSQTPADEQQGWQTCVERGRGVAVEQRFCDEELGRPPAAGSAPRYGWYYFSRGYYWNAPAIGSEVPQGGSFSSRPFASAPVARTGARLK